MIILIIANLQASHQAFTFLLAQTHPPAIYNGINISIINAPFFYLTQRSFLRSIVGIVLVIPIALVPSRTMLSSLFRMPEDRGFWFKNTTRPNSVRGTRRFAKPSQTGGSSYCRALLMMVWGIPTVYFTLSMFRSASM